MADGRSSAPPSERASRARPASARGNGAAPPAPGKATAPNAAPPGPPTRGDRPVRLAAIDIGSNSIRQIVADVSRGGAIRIVDEMKAAPRLGSGLDQTHRMSEASMRHAFEAIDRMATLARQLGAQRVEGVSTSAVRDAENGAQFLDRVRRRSGIPVRMLRGEDEARLGFRSALAHFDLGVGRAVVVDIGGGSAELALSADGLIDRLISLPFGAIRLTEQFLRGRPRFKDVKKLRAHVRDAIRKLLPVRDWRGAQLIGSGGTFTNLGAMFLARQGVPYVGRVHGTHVSREELEHIIETLQELTPEERANVPGLNPARADIIVGGLVVAAEIMGRLEARHLTVSGYGLREGLLLEMARVTPKPADPGEARERSVLSFAERCHYEVPHSPHVRDLALQLFDAIGTRLGCTAADRRILSDAALLHDVGYHINYDDHHRHSYHLIVHADLLGIAPDEQVAIANVARYHRGAPPKQSHDTYTQLDRAWQKRVRRLAAILRVADGLDRGHGSAVKKIKVRWGERALRITPMAASKARNLRLELWGASRKAALLSKVAGVPVEIVGPDGQVIRGGRE
jgi:exopolyphosphatase/guanosine-5'-triphosphate,3'-diphosphate pyrophosphatase